jgi:hypothetical protein
MGLIGQGSNRDLAGRLDCLADRIACLHRSFATAESRLPVRAPRRRRRWEEVAEAILVVLESSGELRSRDIHVAVEALLDEPVSRSSVKHCLAKWVAEDPPLFERIGRARYRLPR